MVPQLVNKVAGVWDESAEEERGRKDGWWGWSELGWGCDELGRAESCKLLGCETQNAGLAVLLCTALQPVLRLRCSPLPGRDGTVATTTGLLRSLVGAVTDSRRDHDDGGRRRRPISAPNVDLFGRSVAFARWFSTLSHLVPFYSFSFPHLFIFYFCRFFVFYFSDFVGFFLPLAFDIILHYFVFFLVQEETSIADREKSMLVQPEFVWASLFISGMNSELFLLLPSKLFGQLPGCWFGWYGVAKNLIYIPVLNGAFFSSMCMCYFHHELALSCEFKKIGSMWFYHPFWYFYFLTFSSKVLLLASFGIFENCKQNIF